MRPCPDCAGQLHRLIAAKTDDRNAEEQAKQYAKENNTLVGLYRDEHGRVQFTRYPQPGYFFFAIISPLRV